MAVPNIDSLLESRICGNPMCYCGECRCLNGDVEYLKVFPEEMRDKIYGRLGPHPSVYMIARELYHLTGSDQLPESFRLVDCGKGVLLKDLPGDYSWVSFNQALYMPGYDRPVAYDLRVVGTPRCCVYGDPPLPSNDGYCYLALYPRDQWYELARRLGPWPTVQQLPSGRYPAAAVEVIAPALQSLALHCAPCGSNVPIDQLADYAQTMRVGGGYGDRECGHLDPMRLAAPCEQCLAPQSVTVGEPDALCFCPGGHELPSLVQLEEAHKHRPVVTTGERLTDFFLIRDVERDEWRLPVAAEPTKLQPERLVPVFLHRVDDTGQKALSITGRQWLLQFPVGVTIEFGPYILNCRRETAIVGCGPFQAIVRPGHLSGSTDILGRGLTAASALRLMHTMFACDPSDRTARLTTYTDCPLYYAPVAAVASPNDAVFIPPEYFEKESVAVHPRSHEDDAQPDMVRIVNVPTGYYSTTVVEDGLVFETFDCYLFVGVLVCAPGGKVCVCRSDGWKDGSACLIKVSHEPGGIVTPWWRSVAAARLAHRLFPRFRRPDVHGLVPKGVNITIVDDAYAMDRGGPSDDGKGGSVFGDEFDFF